MLRDTADTTPSPRDRHIQAITKARRVALQKASGYTQRATLERQIGRWKQVLGPSLRFHTDEAQATEVAIAIAIAVVVLDRMLDLGRPNSVRSA